MIEGVSQQPDPVVADSEVVKAEPVPVQIEPPEQSGQPTSASDEPAIPDTTTQAAAPDPAGGSAVAVPETGEATDLASSAGETPAKETALTEPAQAEGETAEAETETASASLVQEPAEADATGGSPDNGAAVTGNPAQPAAAQIAGDAEAGSPTQDAPVPEALAQEETEAETGTDVPLFEAPLLDLVRVGPTGETVIAGRATAGVLVEVLLDGAPIEQVEVQAGGDFVAFADLPPSRQPRVISLRASAQGQNLLSDSSFIVAPANPVTAASEPDETEQVAQATEGGETGGGATDLSSSEDLAQTGESASQAATATVADGGGTEQANAAQSAPSPDASQAAEITPSETEIAQVAETPAAKAPQGVATQAPDSAAPAAVLVAPETTLTADATTAVAQPGATTPGAVEEITEVETQTAPQPEPTQVAVLRADAEGITLVQPIAQKPQGKVVLDTISYSDSGEVQLAGRAGASSKVLVYLDNAPAGQFVAAQNGSWGGRLQAVTPGVYTLRLDEVNDLGKVLSRLETPFKREAPEVLQPPASEGAAGEGAPLVRAVTVQEGDTLWAISQQRYGSGFLYVRVFEANQSAIRDPDLIYPGQVFALPE